MKELEAQIRPITARKTLAQEVVENLTELLMKGVWKPGDQIPSEKELSERFGVGRSTIRESLQSLIVIGVLESHQGGRTIVKETSSELLSGAFQWGLLLSQQNVGDLAEVRRTIEVECAGLAAERIDKEDVEIIEDILNQMALNQRDENTFMDLDNRFHIQIAKGSNNPIYINLVSTIQSLIRIWYPSTLDEFTNRDQTISEHKLLMESIKCGDVEQARKSMENHILEASKRLNEIITVHESKK